MVSTRRKGWRSLLLVGVISSLESVLLSSATQAQIIPDSTVGTQVFGVCNGSGGACGITSGTTRGSNLFHSFQQFSLPNKDFAAFVTNPTIQNILVRITGTTISNLNGTIITVDPTFTNIIPVNFFLLNPNGIVFGPNAHIFVGGSFLASTAEQMLFQDGTMFGTHDQTIAPLLTVSAPVGLQMGAAPGNIQATGLRLGAGVNSLFGDFVLVGGDVALDNSIILAPGQRIELAGIGSNGTVGLQLSGDRFSLSPVLAGILRQDITLSNGSTIDVNSTTGGGEVVVTGRNISLSGGSSIGNGIVAGVGNAATNQAGDTTVSATGSLQLTQDSLVFNDIGKMATGHGGNVSITASDIVARDSSGIETGTFGRGNAGNVSIKATSITLDGTSPDETSASGIFSAVNPEGIGQSGDITIQTNSLYVTNGAVINASTAGIGNGGTVKIVANSITLDGATPDGLFSSGIASDVNSTGTGNGGNVAIDAHSLIAQNGAVVSTSTFGKGDGGSIKIKTGSIVLDGTAPGSQLASGIASIVLPSSNGIGGNIYVETNSLTITNGAVVSTNTFGNGVAGSVIVKASKIKLDGTTPNRQFSSGISSEVVSPGTGNGGDVTVVADFLTVAHGAEISATTLGNGNAGNVKVTASTIILDGTTPNGRSRISSEVALAGNGKGGDVTVQTGSLSVINGATISVSTRGNGDAGSITLNLNSLDAASGGEVQATTFSTGKAGNIVINARDNITLSGKNTGIFANTLEGSTGDGGSIIIDPREITLQDGASISTTSLGTGRGGDISIGADRISLSNSSSIKAETASAQGGNLILDIHDLLLMRYGSLISTTAGTAQAGGNGGNITIKAPFIIGILSENSDITANAFTGSGGSIDITTNGIYGLKFQPKLTPFSDITASSQFGLNGTVILNLLNVDPSRSLTQLPENLIDTNRILANSCLVRDKSSGGVFLVTGTGGLPEQPDNTLPMFPTGTVRALPDASPAPQTVKPTNDYIAEAQGIYRLPDGQIILSWECNEK